MTSKGVVLALGLLCLAGYSPVLCQESPNLAPIETIPQEAAADSYRPTPDVATARSKDLYVIGLAPPSPDPAETNQVPNTPARTFLAKLLQPPHQLDKRDAETHHHDGHDHTHDHEGHEHDHSSHDHSKDTKNREKRSYGKKTCSVCGAQLGGGYGGGYPSYGGGGYGGGYPSYGGGGGCGGNCGGGGGYARPVYQQPIYQQQQYRQPVCSVCGGGGGGGYGGQSYSQSSSSSSSSSGSYGKK